MEALLIVVLILCVGTLFVIYFKYKRSENGQEDLLPKSEPAASGVPGGEGGSAAGISSGTYVPPAPTTAPAVEIAEPAVYVSSTLTGGADVPKPLPQQHTIYAFEREVQVLVCPQCDGENSINRNTCCICGYEFMRGGWRI